VKRINMSETNDKPEKHLIERAAAAINPWPPNHRWLVYARRYDSQPDQT